MIYRSRFQDNVAETPFNGENVPQLDLSSVTESLDRESVKPQKRANHSVASPPRIAKPVAKKKKKKACQVAKVIMAKHNNRVSPTPFYCSTVMCGVSFPNNMELMVNKVRAV